jgi:twitching motility protein PilI
VASGRGLVNELDASEMRPMAASPERSDSTWLPPGEALGRFVPDPHGGAVTDASPAAVQDAIRYGFRVGDLGLLIPPRVTGEVLDRPRVYLVPNTPPWLRGLCNVRGNLVPVFDLHAILGTGESDREQRWVLVLGEGENAAGLNVDNLPIPVAATHRPSARPPVPAALREHVHQALLAGSDLWLELDLDGFLRSLAPRIRAG